MTCDSKINLFEIKQSWFVMLVHNACTFERCATIFADFAKCWPKLELQLLHLRELCCSSGSRNVRLLGTFPKNPMFESFPRKLLKFGIQNILKYNCSMLQLLLYWFKNWTISVYYKKKHVWGSSMIFIKGRI